MLTVEDAIFVPREARLNDLLSALKGEFMLCLTYRFSRYLGFQESGGFIAEDRSQAHDCETIESVFIFDTRCNRGAE